MTRRKRRTYTPEQKADAVRMARVSGSVAQTARNLDLTESALRYWVRQADVDEGRGPEGALNTDERAELRRLRKRTQQLEQEAAFLKKAAAFFAKESDPRTR